MKLRYLGMSLGIVLMVAGACFGSAGGAPEAPLAVALEPIFQFKPVVDGQEVVHDFIIQNRGTAELEIERVQTG